MSKKKVIDQPVVVDTTSDEQKKEYKLPEDFIHYEFADMVIHCSKCNKDTRIVKPTNIHSFLDITAMMGGPMATDNYSSLGLYCDHCQTMLALKFVPAENPPVEETKEVVEDKVGDVEVVSELVEIENKE